MCVYVCRYQLIWIDRERGSFPLSVICTLLTQKLDVEEKGREHSTVNGFHSHESSWPPGFLLWPHPLPALCRPRSGSLVTDLGAG